MPSSMSADNIVGICNAVAEGRFFKRFPGLALKKWLFPEEAIWASYLLAPKSVNIPCDELVPRSFSFHGHF